MEIITKKEKDIRVTPYLDCLGLTINSGVDSLVECFNKSNALVYTSLVQRGYIVVNFEYPVEITDIKCYGFFKNGKQKKTPISVYQIKTKQT